MVGKGGPHAGPLPEGEGEKESLAPRPSRTDLSTLMEPELDEDRAANSPGQGAWECHRGGGRDRRRKIREERAEACSIGTRFNGAAS